MRTFTQKKHTEERRGEQSRRRNKRKILKKRE
jgi:hypothetical protein